MNNKIKIGLALGGGGARGIAHIGVLKVLEREGIKIDYLCGTSMGALIGACYSLGMTVEEIEQQVLKIRKRDLMKMVDLRHPKRSIIKGNKVYQYITSLIDDAEFSDTKIPFAVVTTNLETGEEEILEKGLIAEAVQASVSVPGIFPPVKIGDSYLIDGGVVNPTPIDVSKNQGADLVIGVDLITKRRVKLDNPGTIAALMQSYDIIRMMAVKYKMQKANDCTVLIRPHVGGIVESFKFSEIPEIIKKGEIATEEMISEIKSRIG
jgi:NTE family protein